ncbi:MAG: radical SAM protein [Nitrospirae bacterium]|nr:radical SAM protein [Nitrospirota bacterium]
MKKISTYINKLRALGLRKFITTTYIKKIRTWYPDMISVEIMTKCNLKCKHCRVTYHGSLIEDVVPAFMEFDFFTKIIDRISPLVKKATSFQFSTIEPLFHKDIFKMMDYVSVYNNKIEYNILSNGMLLNEKNVKELLKRNVSSITVSLDGCTARTVESFKTNTKFDTVVSNISRFKRISGGRIALNVVFVSTKNNIHELVDYVAFCKSLGVDRILVNGFMSFLPELSDLALYSRQGNSEVHEIFKRFYETAKRENIEVELPSLTARPQGCGYTSIMTIDEKGNVSPCILLARKTPLTLFCDSAVVGPVIFGNIFDSDAASIWRSDKSVRFRSMLKKHIIPKECTHCADAYGVICSNRELRL